MNKRSTAQSGSFSLQLVFGSAAVCSLITGTLLAFFHPEAPAKASQRTLTFAERVAYQRTIEDVYWRHRIWPRDRGDRPDPKPSLNAVMTQAQLEKKVHNYLRNSQALEDYWQRPISAEQLQAEMNRMAKNTKQPELLREVFAALENDPFIIAECLARPVLSDRLVTDLSAHDQAPLTSWRAVAENHMPRLIAAASANYTLPNIPEGAGCIDDTWTATGTSNAPDGRYLHTAVWTGSEMIIWGGDNTGGDGRNTGGRYNPSTDSWTATSTTNAPSARFQHTVVWTGSEMIVWGGYSNGSNLNTGGRYNPSTDSWTATSTTNAPDARNGYTAVWTDSEMIVWGGWNGTYLNTGARYNPSNDSWTATSITNAPSSRDDHTAVWSGSEMIVWGGYDGTYSNTGGRYNPNIDTWTATSITDAPAGRYWHTAVWTGSEMIVWGGGAASPTVFNTGGRYHPDTDSWTATNTTSAPVPRNLHTAVWTSGEMIIWGGLDPFHLLGTGGRYNPSNDSWTATSTTNAPTARFGHTAVWGGSEMIVWGGDAVSTPTARPQLADQPDVTENTGGRYCAAAPSPTPTATATATAAATATSSPTPTPTPSEPPCSVIGTQPLCDSIVLTQLTDFVVYMSAPVDPTTVQPSDFRVNEIPADSDMISGGGVTITFHFNASPVGHGLNLMDIPAGAFDCLFTGRPFEHFSCTFTYQPSTPTPRPSPTPRPRPTPPPRP